jgi:hypothetical protein
MIERGGKYPRHQKLLTKELRDKLPELYSGEKVGLEAKALVKFFTPSGSWTWYASEFDGADTFFGLVSGFEVELGYFSLSELEGVRDALGLPIERDLYFLPKSLKELMEAHQRVQTSPAPDKEASQGILRKVNLFAGQLSEWNKQIVEVSMISNPQEAASVTDQAILLACTFDPEPKDSSEGFFSISNLLVRNDYEHGSENLGIANPIDLGFKMKGKLHLPDGTIRELSEDQILVWPRNAK